MVTTIDKLKPIADFLLTHGVVYDESKMVWVLYDKYPYQSLREVIRDEQLWPLMDVVYKIKWQDVMWLEYPSLILFHELGLVKS